MCRDNELKKAEKISVDFFVKCPVCGAIYKNRFGSLPCCGSLPYEFKITDLIDLPTETGKQSTSNNINVENLVKNNHYDKEGNT